MDTIDDIDGMDSIDTNKLAYATARYLELATCVSNARGFKNIEQTLTCCCSLHGYCCIGPQCLPYSNDVYSNDANDTRPGYSLSTTGLWLLLGLLATTGRRLRPLRALFQRFLDVLDLFIDGHCILCLCLLLRRCVLILLCLLTCKHINVSLHRRYWGGFLMPADKDACDDA